MDVIETAGAVLMKTQVKGELQEKGTRGQSSQLCNTSSSACASTADVFII